MSVYDAVMEEFSRCPERPYALRLTARHWAELRADPRTKPTDFYATAGDPPLFMRVPVRIEGRRKAGVGFKPQVFETAEELHDAIYG